VTVALVTGITGQDGSYLAERLVAEGVEIHGLVRPGDPALSVLQDSCPGLFVHEGDLRDGARLEALVLDLVPDEVYNLAGLSSVAQSWDDPVRTAEVTGLAVARLLHASWLAQEQSGQAVRFLQASSAEIFGDSDRVPQDENTPLCPTSPYGAAKAYAHQLVGVYRARGLYATSTILYNHESPRRPPSFVTRKITAGAVAIAAGTAHELVLGNLDVQRDWGWAPDYVDAMVRAIRHDRADDFVVATGQARSVRDFVTAAFLRAGIPDWPAFVRTDSEFVRPVEASMLVGDPSKALRELGWKSTVGFDEIVGRMVDHDASSSRAQP
jgi:GDPmannose 4,6-dehydratase